MSLKVQGDRLGRVVRILGEGETHELRPDKAREMADRLVEAAEEAESEASAFAGVPPADQTEFGDFEGGASEPEFVRTATTGQDLDDLRERDEPPEPGDVINPNNPLDW